MDLPVVSGAEDAAISERKRVLSSVRIKVSLSLMVASIVLGLSVVMYLSVSAIFAQLTPRIRADLIWKVESGVAELRRATDLGLVTLDVDYVAEAARRYVQDSDVLGVVVSTPDGDALYRHGVSPLPDSELRRSPANQALVQEEYIAAWGAVAIEGRPVGSVSLFVSTERLRAGVELRQRILGVAALGSLLALLAALTFVNRRVMPVLRVTEAAFRELEEKSEAALESARIKGQFLANMSHEIRTPLNGIVGIIGLLREMRQDALVARYVEVMDVSARSLMTIVNDILDFSKIEAGKLTVRKEAVNPGRLVQEVIELVGERAYAKGIELTSRSDERVPTAFLTDGDRFRQVLTNLVVNAIKFTERGKVTIRLQVDAECLKVVIEDTGIGISEKDQARLFKAFSQIDGSSVRNQGGTGLGLAISQRLVGALGGRLGLESTPGAGSRFWFTLPLEGATHEAPKNKLPGQRVMIVSDSEDVCESIREYLERWDMQGLPEASGLEALDRMQQLAQQGQAVSAVILSASSADLGAAEFIELLGQAATIKDVPVLLLRDPGAEHVPARLSACVFAELARPFRASDLYDALTRTFGAVSRADPRRSAPSPPNAARLKVLIVDDNEVNRFVAVQQVERLGYAAETACNGQEAVAKVVDGDFSAVLMDCQMPVMDGYEATREIRRREGGSRYTPIIALTAHALARERDKCTAAGMDGYLTKPARADTLRAALERWTAARRSGQSGPMRAPSPPPETLREPPPSDPTSTPEEIARAPVLADEERPARLVELFLDRTPPLIEELRRAIERADTGELRARAHKLKGSCLAVGAERMALLAAQLQHAGEHGDARAAERGLAPLLEQWSSVRERLEREQRSALAGASAQSDGG